MASHAPFGKRSRIPRSNKPKGKPRGKPFAKGTINNPLGRPKLPPGTREAFQQMLPSALGTLQEVFSDPLHPRQEQAAEYVVNQALGTARQSVDLRSPDGCQNVGSNRPKTNAPKTLIMMAAAAVLVVGTAVRSFCATQAPLAAQLNIKSATF